MGYREASGLILQRRDLFENDQEIKLLTGYGGIEARAPHARKSQKTFCGRLEPPNAVSTRLYRARKNSWWTVSSVSIETVYADLMRDDQLRYRLWPLLALFRDLFPEGEQPGTCLDHLRKALEYLKEGFRPALLVTNRVLTHLAERTGVAFETDRCTSCQQPLRETAGRTSQLISTPEAGMLCSNCVRTDSVEGGLSNQWPLSVETIDLYDDLRKLQWEEVCARDYTVESLKQLEEHLYRLFRYHFEISLDTLDVRKSL
ncbi:MAG: DNA repair protein RecO [bacterium]